MINLNVRIPDNLGERLGVLANKTGRTNLESKFSVFYSEEDRGTICPINRWFTTSEANV